MNKNTKAMAEYTIIPPGLNKKVRLHATLELIPAPVKAGNRNALQLTINGVEDSIAIYNVMFDTRFNTLTRFRQNCDQFMRDLYPDDWVIYNEWSWEV